MSTRRLSGCIASRARCDTGRPSYADRRTRYVVEVTEVAERELRAELPRDVVTSRQQRLEPPLAGAEQFTLIGVRVGAAVVQQLLHLRQYGVQAGIRQQTDVLGELRELEPRRSRVALVDEHQ